MKNIFTILSNAMLGCAISLVTLNAGAQGTMKSDSVIMSAGYANEVYYNMGSGIVKTTPRASWDIAFRTSVMSSGIITNDGSGVVLYTYPKADTSGWANVDTTGYMDWTPMYNDPTDWENGAFSRNATGHPDYGWGRYNDVTHNLTGDSLFVIKLRDQSFRKLRIVGKQSAADIYTFRYANLDGSGEQTIVQDFSSFTDVDYMGYSLQTNELVPFQPAKSTWDILFTKYMSVQDNGSPYPVIGVLSKEKVKTKNFHPVALTYDDFGAGTWDSTRSSIGWNWKEYYENAYHIVDSSVYFIKPLTGDVYKLIFTFFKGTSTGLIKFELKRSAGAGFPGSGDELSDVVVFPNPASSRINISMTGSAGEDLTFTLTDLSGRQLRADRPGRMADGPGVYSMDVTGVQPGIYFVTVSNAATKTVTKVIITR